MIEEILPDLVIAVEARHDPTDAVLFAVEESAVGRAVEKRRREFTTARVCARTALERLGLPAVPVPMGERGEPQWPVGIVGSITHCDGYRACAVARSTAIVALGIDAERNAPLPDGLLSDIARAEEIPRLRELQGKMPEVHWDRLLFSAKESIYKAWFPLAQRWLGFEDAVVALDPGTRTFSARLLVSGPPLADGPLTGLTGRWLVRDGLVLTSIVVGASGRSPDMVGYQT